MEKDYSEYQHTKYDIYRARRSNRKDVILDYFVNKASFSPEDKTIRIVVDSYNEFDAMQDYINEVEEAQAAREGRTYTPFEVDTDSAEWQENLEDSQKMIDLLREKYNIVSLGRFESSDSDEEFHFVSPMINALSGSYIDLSYGEGILDFIYADFVTPLKDALRVINLWEALGKQYHEEKIKSGEVEEPVITHEPEKIYSKSQEIVDDFYDYESTFGDIEDVAYASLYSAICPPIFKGPFSGKKNRLRWYGNYLLELQKEFKELI